MPDPHHAHELRLLEEKRRATGLTPAEEVRRSSLVQALAAAGRSGAGSGARGGFASGENVANPAPAQSSRPPSAQAGTAGTLPADGSSAADETLDLQEFRAAGGGSFAPADSTVQRREEPFDTGWNAVPVFRIRGDRAAPAAPAPEGGELEEEPDGGDSSDLAAHALPLTLGEASEEVGSPPMVPLEELLPGQDDWATSLGAPLGGSSSASPRPERGATEAGTVAEGGFAEPEILEVGEDVIEVELAGELPGAAPGHASPRSGGETDGSLVAGTHRVVVHTNDGQVKRGSMTDAELAASLVVVLPQAGGLPESIASDGVKAIFFMQPISAPPPEPEGEPIRVTFRDGRQVVGTSKGHLGTGAGFFLVPSDPRTRTARIWVYRAAVRAIAPGTRTDG